jgi:hypothetical protein
MTFPESRDREWKVFDLERMKMQMCSSRTTVVNFRLAEHPTSIDGKGRMADVATLSGDEWKQKLGSSCSRKRMNIRRTDWRVFGPSKFQPGVYSIDNIPFFVRGISSQAHETRHEPSGPSVLLRPATFL